MFGTVSALPVPFDPLPEYDALFMYSEKIVAY